MAVIAFRPRAMNDEAPTGETSTHPFLSGSFLAPNGAAGQFEGCLRVDRLLFTPHGAYVRGVVTGVLSNAQGAVICRDSRTVTLLAALRRQDGRTMAFVDVFDVDLMGITVRVSEVALDPHFASSHRRRPLRLV